MDGTIYSPAIKNKWKNALMRMCRGCCLELQTQIHSLCKILMNDTIGCIKTDLNVKEWMPLREGLHERMQCDMRQHFAEHYWLHEHPRRQSSWTESVKGMYPAPHIHEHFTIHKWLRQTAYILTHNLNMLEHIANNGMNTTVHTDANIAQF